MGARSGLGLHLIAMQQRGEEKEVNKRKPKEQWRLTVDYTCQPEMIRSNAFTGKLTAIIRGSQSQKGKKSKR